MAGGQKKRPFPERHRGVRCPSLIYFAYLVKKFNLKIPISTHQTLAKNYSFIVGRLWSGPSTPSRGIMAWSNDLMVGEVEIIVICS
jgi:hypothetical protein